MSIKFYDFLSYLQVTQDVDKPAHIKDMGILVYFKGRLIPLGGLMCQFSTTEKGIFIKNARVIVPAGCGHILKSIDDIAGFCSVCVKLICSKEGCLEFCDETGAAVCRRCRVVTRDGRTVARPEARKLGSIVKSLIGPKRKELTYEK